MKNLDKITTLLYDLEADELVTLNKRVVARMKEKGKEDAERNRNLFSVGEKVETFGLKSGNGETGTIKKINRTRANVDLEGKVYSVPLNCLKKVQ